MTRTAALTLSLLGMFSSQPRLVERALADIAVIQMPRAVKEMYEGLRDDQPGRLTFTFASSYFWASFGSGTAYKQQLFVSLMAPDANDAEYEAYPKHMSLSYDERTTVRTTALGSGTLTITRGVYRQNTLREPAHTFFYVDRARRLQIAWHAVEKEVDLTTGAEVIGRMAASFRIVRDPVEQFAEVRDRPRKEAEAIAGKRAMAVEMLKREGFGAMEPGKPVLRDGVYVEWMTDPELRFQLVLPLGRVRVAPDATPGTRPRPVAAGSLERAGAKLAGTIGWREYADGQWRFSNNENDYLPFAGVGAALAATLTDPAFVYFYYSASVRVEEVDEKWLAGTGWFFDTVPEVRRLWRGGKLVRYGTPERDG